MDKCQFDKAIASKLYEDAIQYIPDRLVEWDGIEDVIRKILKHYFYQMRTIHNKIDDDSFDDFVRDRLTNIVNLAFSDVVAISIGSSSTLETQRAEVKPKVNEWTERSDGQYEKTS